MPTAVELPTPYGTARMTVYDGDKRVAVIATLSETPDWEGRINGIRFRVNLMLRREPDGTWVYRDDEGIGAEVASIGGIWPRLDRTDVREVREAIAAAVNTWQSTGRRIPFDDAAAKATVNDRLSRAGERVPALVELLGAVDSVQLRRAAGDRRALLIARIANLIKTRRTATNDDVAAVLPGRPTGQYVSRMVIRAEDVRGDRERFRHAMALGPEF